MGRLGQTRQSERDRCFIREMDVLLIDSVSGMLCVLAGTVIQNPSGVCDPNDGNYGTAILREVASDIEVCCPICGDSDRSFAECIGLASGSQWRGLEVFLHSVGVIYADQRKIRLDGLKGKSNHPGESGIESHHCYIEVVTDAMPELEVGRINGEVGLVRLPKLNIGIVVGQQGIDIALSRAIIEPRCGLGMDGRDNHREKEARNYEGNRYSLEPLHANSPAPERIMSIPATDFTQQDDSRPATEDFPEPGREFCCAGSQGRLEECARCGFISPAALVLRRSICHLA